MGLYVGRVTELIYYLNNELSKEITEKHYSHLTVTDKIAQARHELRCKTMRKQADVSLTAENN